MREREIEREKRGREKECLCVKHLKKKKIPQKDLELQAKPELKSDADKDLKQEPAQTHN